ncbi:putative cholecystokinin receptor type A-like [Apostichopus japonicus]|uniref:Putative cholecystokinin receptor type A-like n=1 Tax=Stichopus japonicus TaxID=307972 RepID=A0A2G8KUD7_STIJA|nr:putative cholecystokinin receptor type A-like [Apostichopus japonicus]
MATAANLTTAMTAVNSDNTGNDNESCPYVTLDFRNEDLLQIYVRTFDPFELVILPVLGAIGLLANACFLFVVWKTPSMRNNLNKYLCALATVDISVFVLGLGERYLRYISPLTFDMHSRTFGSAGCAINVSVELTYYCSLLFMTLISLERYYAVCKPLRHRSFIGGKRTRRQFLVAFSIAVIIVLSLIPYRGIPIWYCLLYPENGKYDTFPKRIAVCTSVSELASLLGRIIQALPFYITLFANLFFYIRIIYELRKWESTHKPDMVCYDNRGAAVEETDFSTSVTIVPSTQTTGSLYSLSAEESHMTTISSNMPRESVITLGGKISSSNTPKLIDKYRSTQRAVTRMLLINGLVFFLCNSPIQFYFTSLSILQLFGIYVQLNATLLVIFQALLYLNSAVNPFIYGVTNASYRAAFKKAVFPCMFKK